MIISNQGIQGDQLINLFKKKILFHNPLTAADDLYHHSGGEEDVEGDVHVHVHHHGEQVGFSGTFLQIL